MELSFAIWILLAAFGAGSLGVMCGFGGGIFLVPILSVLLGVPLKTAIATSVLCVVVNSLAGSRVYLQHTMVNLRLGLLLQTTTTLGVLLGAMLVVIAPIDVLNVIFALTLYGVIVALLRNPRSASHASGGPDRLLLRSTYEDAATHETIDYIPGRVPLGTGLSVLGGAVSGIMGIGGGPIQVPVMTAIMGVPLKAAAATSTFMVGITACTSAMIYFSSGLIDLSIAPVAVFGILIGANLGSQLNRHIPTRILMRIVAGILAVFATLILLQAFGFSLR